MQKHLKYTATLGLLVQILIYSGCIPIRAQNSDQVMFRGDEKHSGVYNSGIVNNPPSLKWKFKTGGPISSSGTLDGDKIYFGSTDSNLYCLNAISGDLLWKFKTGGAVNSSPAIRNGVVYFGSYDGVFYALQASDGSVKWTFKTDGEKRFSALGIHGNLPKDSLFQDDWDFYLSSPVMDDNDIYFGTGSGYFYSLNASTGKQNWKFKTDGVIHSSPALAFGNVYFGGWDTYMHALNAKTGSEIWKFKTGVDTETFTMTGITGSPMISGQMLYFGCRDSYMYALNAMTGALKWKKYNGDGWISVSPVVYNDKLIYLSGSSEDLVELNKITGDSIYQLYIKRMIFSSPSLVNDQIYFGDMSGEFNSFDVNTGKLMWAFGTDGFKEDKYKILNPDGSINDDKFVEIAKMNRPLSRMQIRLSLGSILSSPVIQNGIVYFGSGDGYFYALQ